MSHSDLVKHVVPNRPWYAVRYLLRDEGNKLYQEDTVLVIAQSHDEALKKGEKIAEEFCESMPEYKYTGYAETFQLFEESPEEGVEVYSTIRESSLEPKEYIEHYLRTGTEKGFISSFD
jgi:hypothetical protein